MGSAGDSLATVLEALLTTQKKRQRNLCFKCGWPWYSKVAPMSWMIENDVRLARSKMNLSHWEQYSEREREAFLTMIGIAVQTKEMPLPRYTLLHPEARLSSGEIEAIRSWTRMERNRLRRPVP